MMASEIEELRARLDMVEAQTAALAGYTHMLLNLHLETLPEQARPEARVVLATVCEKLIADLLASSLGFSDAAVRGAQNMRDALFGKQKTDPLPSQHHHHRRRPAWLLDGPKMDRPPFP